MARGPIGPGRSSGRSAGLVRRKSLTIGWARSGKLAWS